VTQNYTLLLPATQYTSNINHRSRPHFKRSTLADDWFDPPPPKGEKHRFLVDLDSMVQVSDDDNSNQLETGNCPAPLNYTHVSPDFKYDPIPTSRGLMPELTPKRNFEIVWERMKAEREIGDLRPVVLQTKGIHAIDRFPKSTCGVMLRNGTSKTLHYEASPRYLENYLEPMAAAKGRFGLTRTNTETRFTALTVRSTKTSTRSFTSKSLLKTSCFLMTGNGL
jgi:hypothetical protein